MCAILAHIDDSDVVQHWVARDRQCCMHNDSEFSAAVCRSAQQIPYGHVTTYGHLARLAGRPRNARQVGAIMKFLSTSPLVKFNTNSVPWWRVINSSGRIASRPGQWEHALRLRQEVPVSESGTVSLARYGWFPDILEVTEITDAASTHLHEL